MLSSEYFAGFFDADGSVSIHLSQAKHRMDKYGYGQHSLQCTVSNISADVLTEYKQRFGGHMYGPFTRFKDRPKQKPIYCWNVRGEIAGRFLRTIAPYVFLKQKQVALGIEFESSRRRTRPLTIDELEKRESFRQRMMLLNMHKGPKPLEFRLLKAPVPIQAPWARADANPKAKLSWGKVREIRNRFAKGEKRTPLADEFGVDPSQVDHIVRNEQWKEPTAGS